MRQNRRFVGVTATENPSTRLARRSIAVARTRAGC
jgi:hypothetical protein